MFKLQRRAFSPAGAAPNRRRYDAAEMAASRDRPAGFQPAPEAAKMAASQSLDT